MFHKIHNLITLTAAWILMAAIHAFMGFTLFQWTAGAVLVDIVINASTFVLMGIGLGHFISARTQKIEIQYSTVFILVLTLFIMAALWILATFIIMNSLIPSILTIPFFNLTLPLRFLIGVLSFSILILVFYLSSVKELLTDEKKHAEELKRTMQATELSLLQAQINPHFLFNSLNSLAALTLNEPRQAHSMIIVLSDYLRMGLHKGDSFILLEEELENCRRYLQIEKMRFKNRMDALFDITEEAEKFLLPHTLLQPVYENAVKYGVSESTDTIQILTRAYVKDNYLYILISNDLPDGIPARKGKGMGLSNINRRLELYYRRPGLIRVNKTDKQFDVSFTLPVLKSK